ncbi:hypothetical protein [Nonomuraea wenchangensis]|uniref:hypothetical protein n=1 Tax=Nonomuraea wenchangensis TaxID=568860 RepID=UPI0033247CC2
MSEIMTSSKVDGPISPKHMIGRDEEAGMIRVWAREDRLMALIAPLWFGKTSVIGKVAAEGDRGGLAVISADLFEVASLADLVLRLERAWGRCTPDWLRTTGLIEEAEREWRVTDPLLALWIRNNYGTRA